MIILDYDPNRHTCQVTEGASSSIIENITQGDVEKLQTRLSADGTMVALVTPASC